MRVESLHDPVAGSPAAAAPAPLGWSGPSAPVFDPDGLAALLSEPRTPVTVVYDPASGARGLAADGGLVHEPGAWPVLASLPPVFPEWLGDRAFTELHGLSFPYVVGAMANGITTADMVEAAAAHGFLAFFGAAGLGVDRVEAAVTRLSALSQQGRSWGSNLIHSPTEPALEAAVVNLYLKYGVNRVSASAFMDLTPALVRYALSGVRQAPDGSIHRERYVFAKISRPEVAARMLAPAPAEMVAALVARGELTEDEARLAPYLPVAEDITVESDSGGHTDNQALGSLFPIIARLRDQLSAKHGYTRPIRVGAAGGLGSPSAVASAFGLGAAYVLTGSVNQACVESGLSAIGREQLAKAQIADVTMAPAADMFEMGVDVQVLKRGTMFAQRGHYLRALYRGYRSFAEIPAEDRARVEKTCLRRSFDAAWADTKAYWQRREPAEVERAERDPKHQMALVFRAYLGQASRWAIDGLADRAVDYQIWCGPAMGSFNAWVQGSFLEAPEARNVGQVGLNLLEGAAVVTRAHQLRAFGVPVPPRAFDFAPRPLSYAL